MGLGMSLATVTAILQFTTVAVKAGAEKRVQEVAEVVILLIRLYQSASMTKSL